MTPYGTKVCKRNHLQDLCVGRVRRGDDTRVNMRPVGVLGCRCRVGRGSLAIRRLGLIQPLT